jgi:hypothetical protein
LRFSFRIKGDIKVPLDDARLVVIGLAVSLCDEQVGVSDEVRGGGSGRKGD